MCWNVEIKLNYNKHTYLTLEALKNHMPTKDYFVGIDSDGTVFDSMEVKHKDCFVGSLIRIFELAAIAHEVHLVWNHVNIFSNTRGTNRFKALILTFNYLREIDRVKQLGIHFPKLNILKQWIKKGKILSNESLMNLINGSVPEERLVLIKILKWSEEVNRTVKNTVFNLPPLEGAKTAMASLKPHADIMVISNTPLDTLHREWSENKIFSNVLYIGGQETGTKTEMLMRAAKQKYDNDKILVIGDSPGDLYAAKNVEALFYPILPTKEIHAWDNFNKEYLDVFLKGDYSGEKEKRQIEEFNTILKSTPPWAK